MIEEAQCGYCVNAGDYEGLAKLMEEYISSPDDYKECGNNARDYFRKHFTLEHYMNGLEAELRGLVKR